MLDESAFHYQLIIPVQVEDKMCISTVLILVY